MDGKGLGPMCPRGPLQSTVRGSKADGTRREPPPASGAHGRGRGRQRLVSTPPAATPLAPRPRTARGPRVLRAEAPTGPARRLLSGGSRRPGPGRRRRGSCRRGWAARPCCSPGGLRPAFEQPPGGTDHQVQRVRGAEVTGRVEWHAPVRRGRLGGSPDGGMRDAHTGCLVEVSDVAVSSASGPFRADVCSRRDEGVVAVRVEIHEHRASDGLREILLDRRQFLGACGSEDQDTRDPYGLEGATAPEQGETVLVPLDAGAVGGVRRLLGPALCSSVRDGSRGTGPWTSRSLMICLCPGRRAP